MKTKMFLSGLLLGGGLLLGAPAMADEGPASPREGRTAAERERLTKLAPKPAANPLQAERLPRTLLGRRGKAVAPLAPLGVSFEAVLDRVEDGAMVLGEAVPEALRRMKVDFPGARNHEVPRRIERALRLGPQVAGEESLRRLLGQRVVVELGRDGTGAQYALSVRPAKPR
jgi:hypothetical protein